VLATRTCVINQSCIYFKMASKDRIINEETIQCECGAIITGTSKKHTKANLRLHKLSKKHKKNMGLLK